MRLVVMKLVTQEHPMGCAVACVASLTGKTYRRALELFIHPEYASSRGYYCQEICDALSSAGYSYAWKKARPHLIDDRTIVFIARSKAYPQGHFLLKTKRGWMNPWGNYPCIKPAKALFQKDLPGKLEWIIYQRA